MKELEAVSKIRVFLKEEGFIVPKKPLQEFYSNIVRLSGLGIGGILHMSGKKAGKIAGNLLKDIMGPGESSVEEIELYLKVFLEEAGICRVKSWEHVDGLIRLRIEGSVFAEGQESKKPVCIPLQGALAGVLEELTGKRWECKELECEAQGKDSCLFELRVEK
ncbi:4-vinyl reductase 4VR [Thermocrinis albus DSM 14484]|uniref:4-vinyl reductase 4VR n=1 Tax=Thermocrinis albus (strain DSM 14484 / JCM 11386 / HI 11/12) TaxID=638303 RepID=D3SPF2_THEAH|nr:V4R domain-containing protein [Thermocrinis albus]ADC89039.1 4-vinyl reductase 4VR [Thermocrinis albus DSM 14484]